MDSYGRTSVAKARLVAAFPRARAGSAVACAALALAAALPAAARAAAAETDCGGSAASGALAPDSFTSFFTRSGAGLTGGDQAQSVPLPDGRTAWLFADSFLGTVAPDGTRAAGTPSVHNAVAIQDGGCLTTFHGGSAGNPAPLVSPPDPSHWFWPADGTVDGNTLKIVENEYAGADSGMTGFQHVGDSVATLSLTDLSLLYLQPLPGGGGVSWGSSILEDGYYTYIYGVEDISGGEKYSHVARVPTGRMQYPDEWSYFTGSGWSTDPASSARMLGGISNLYSVIHTGSGYTLISQGVFFSRTVTEYHSSSPTGPWSAGTPALTLPDPGSGLVAYNGVAHPEFDQGGQLLLGYSVDPFDQSRYFSDASTYRPRFASIPIPGYGSAPDITASAASGGAPYAAGSWTTQPVTVSFSCRGEGPAVVSDSGPQTIAGDGSTQSVSGSCTDAAGHTATTTFGPVMITTVPPPAPAIVPDRPPDSAGGWYRDAVKVSFQAIAEPPLADGSPAPGINPWTVPPAQTVTHTTAVSGGVSDLAGNRSPDARLAVKVDASPPLVAFTCPQHVLRDSVQSATWIAADFESGLATPSSGAALLDTSLPGPHRVLAPLARDNVGHTSEAASCVYYVTHRGARHSLSIDRRRLRPDRHGHVVIGVRCRAVTLSPCAGTLALAPQRGRGTLAARRFAIPAGAVAGVPLTLSRVASAGRGALTVDARAKLPAEPAVSTRLTLLRR